ncbi:MAG: MMPL family transporter [Proteobacteria bacterium]|nr:MMPL family transporter [Pseudomonadota bacterium]
MNRYIDFIIKNYKTVILTIILLAVVSGYFIPDLEFNSAVDIYFEKEDPKVKTYMEFRDLFKNEEIALITFKDENLFSDEGISIIRNISKSVAKINFVQRVISLTEYQDAVYINDKLSFNNIIPDKHLDDRSLKSIRERILNNKDILQRLISEDGKTTTILVELEHIARSSDQIRVAKHIRIAAINASGNSVQLHFAGPPFAQEEINKLSLKDLSILLPLMLFVDLIIFIIFLGRMDFTIAGGVTLVLTTIISVGFFAMSGEYINQITLIMPTVLLAIAITDGIHLMIKFKEEDTLMGSDHPAATRNTLRAIWLPCLFTSLTKAVGFISLVTATLRPVRILCIFTALSIMIAYGMTISFLPALLIGFKKISDTFTSKTVQGRKIFSKPHHKQNQMTKFILNIAHISTHYTLSTIIAFALVSLIISFGIPKIRFESSWDKMFPEDQPFMKDLRFIEKNIGGSHSNELYIKAKSNEYDFTHPESLKRIDDIQTYLVKKGIASSSVSIATYIRKVGEHLFLQFYRP